MQYNEVESKVHQYGGRMQSKRRDDVIQFDGKEYGFVAVFNDDELADEFLEDIVASSSDREIPDDTRVLTVYFNV